MCKAHVLIERRFVLALFLRRRHFMRATRHPRISLLFFSLAFLGSWLASRGAQANFFDGLGCGSRPMGMGSAYTAVSDDLWAIYYNVAGLDQIGDNMLQAGYVWANPRVHADSPTEADFRDVTKFAYELKAPLVAFALDMDEIFARPMPVHVKFGLVNAIPDNFRAVYYAWDPPTTTPMFYRLGSYWQRVHLLGGVSLSSDYLPWVSVGVGFRFIITANSYSLPQAGGPAGGLIINPILRKSGVLQGANMEMDVNTLVTPTTGILIHPGKNVRLGYSYRGQTSLTLDPVIANATITMAGLDLLSLTIPIKLDVYYTPQQHNWGVSYKWANKILLAMDLSWFRFSRYTSIARGDPDPRWKDSWIPRFGVEYYPIPVLALRGGYFFEPSPIPDQVKTSNFLDNDSHVFSLGLGYALQDPFRIILRPLDFNLAVQYSWLPERTTIKNPAYGGEPSVFETRGTIIAVAGDITLRF
jgi:long-chain fatty acid transport protein